MKYPDDFINKVIQGDCLEVMKDIPDNSVDLVVTDPPYNISKKNDNRDRSKMSSPIHRRKSPIVMDFGKWDNMDRKEFLGFTKDWLSECCRVIKNGGTLISFFNKEDISYIGWTAKKYGFRTRVIFTWAKTNPVPSFRKVNYLSACEFVYIGSKGDKSWTFNFKLQKEMKNYMETPNGSIYKETIHPTEKPIVLIKHFIEIHTNENNLILDPFLGSGTTAVACKRLNRRYIGIEISEEYCKIARERIKKVPKRLDKFVSNNLKNLKGEKKE